jgi:hypothetical protein
MVVLFFIVKPYKSSLVNSFCVVNEGILLVIGFYLFIFLDGNQKESNVRFYGKPPPSLLSRIFPPCK